MRRIEQLHRLARKSEAKLTRFENRLLLLQEGLHVLSAGTVYLFIYLFIYLLFNEKSDPDLSISTNEPMNRKFVSLVTPVVVKFLLLRISVISASLWNVSKSVLKCFTWR